MAKIRLLDEQVAAQIAAGEVIERPVSVVKELIENAIDASATRIDIDIEQGGMSLIRVTDNGRGMDKEDLSLAFQRHATSKISAFKDLYTLHSFGFRGEALASMLAVSQVKVSSGQSKEEAAWLYIPETEASGTFKKIPPLQGTIMEIRNLFYNVPARRKFVRSNSHESSRIHHITAMTALAYPEVDFNLRIDGNMHFQTTNYREVRERMILIYGDHLSDHLLYVPKTELSPGVELEAWMSDSSIHRSNRKDISCFINGRYVESPELNQLVMEAYYSYIPDGKFPVAHVRLDLPPETIDVNIHPQKTTVQIQGLSRYRSKFIEILKDCLWESRISLPLKREPMFFEKELPSILEKKQRESNFTVEPSESEILEKKESSPTSWPSLTGYYNKRQTSDRISLDEVMLQTQESGPVYQPQMRKKANHVEPLGHREQSFQASSTKQAELGQLEPIGQLQQTFILAQNDEALFIIDQHTCHERIIYDRLKKSALKKDGISQTLLIPEPIDLSPRQEEVFYRYLIPLRDLGFLFERKGLGQVELHGLPPVLCNIGSFQDLINEILNELEKKERIELVDLLDAVVTSRSCKQAVKARGKLSMDEMRALIIDLSETDKPHTCPHGRPTVMSVTIKSLYKYFQRGSYDPN